jgi:hypothetical protein
VTEQEKAEITPAIWKRLQHASQTITAFSRRADGSIEVWTDSADIYVVRKSGDTWKIVDQTYATF